MKQKTKKVIIFTGGGIGDFILSTSAISLVKQYDKNIAITLVVCKGYLSLVDKNLNIDKIITLKHKYNIVETNKFIRLIYKCFWSIKNFIFFYKHEVCFMFVDSKFFKLFAKYICRVKTIVDSSIVTYNKNMHCSMQSQLKIRSIFPTNNLAIPILPDTSYLQLKIKKMIGTIKQYKVALCTMSSCVLRNWNIKYFDELIKKINNNYDVSFFIMGKSKQEINNGNYLIDNNKNCDIRNLVGKTTLLETKQLLSNMDLLISVDTSMVHLAAVSNICTISFYGFSLPSSFMGINHKAISLSSNEKCSPCDTKYHNNRFFCKYPKCMYNITPETVFEKVREVL